MVPAPPSELRLAPFVIGGGSFEPIHTLSKVEAAATTEFMARYLRDVFEIERPQAVLCGPGNFYTDRSNAYYAYAQREVDAGRQPDFERFSASWDAGISDADCDPRLHSLTFGMRDRSREIFGAFMFYNVAVKSQNHRKVTCSGYPAPGFPIKGNPDWATQLSQIVLYFLEANLLLEDGRILDFDEVVFPTEDPRAVWESDNVDVLLAAAAAEGRSVERKRGKLRRLRK